jgi:hypothetical protein
MKNVLNAVTAILVILFFGWQFYVTSCKEECVPNECGSEVTETVIECSETDDSIELDVDTTVIYMSKVEIDVDTIQIDSVTQEEQLINQIMDTMNTDTVIIEG